MSSSAPPEAGKPKPRSGTRWRLFLALLCLVVLVQFLLRHALEGESADDRSSGGREPFPKQGGFSSVPRAIKVEPRQPSAADPWQDGRERE